MSWSSGGEATEATTPQARSLTAWGGRGGRAASLFSDAGHEMVTSVLPHF